MHFHTTIALARPRLAQLKEIARHRGTSVPDLLDAAISDWWRQIGRADEPPPGLTLGWIIDEDTDEFRIRFSGDDLPGVTLSIAEARAFAAGFLAVLGGEKTGFTVASSVQPGARLTGDRKGRGYRLIFRPGHEEAARKVVGMNASIARDLHSALVARLDSLKEKPAAPAV